MTATGALPCGCYTTKRAESGPSAVSSSSRLAPSAPRPARIATFFASFRTSAALPTWELCAHTTALEAGPCASRRCSSVSNIWRSRRFEPDARLDCADDALGHLVLQVEDVTHIALEAIGQAETSIDSAHNSPFPFRMRHRLCQLRAMSAVGVSFAASWKQTFPPTGLEVAVAPICCHLIVARTSAYPPIAAL